VVFLAVPIELVAVIELADSYDDDVVVDWNGIGFGNWMWGLELELVVF
jgi:predicted dinucleotide-binding enzyme